MTTPEQAERALSDLPDLRYGSRAYREARDTIRAFIDEHAEPEEPDPYRITVSKAQYDEILGDPDIRAQYEAAIASDEPLRPRRSRDE